jgi:hypothetical protein
MRHKVEADMPGSDIAIKMWSGDVKPLLTCGRRMKKVVNFYQADELPGSYACSKCFPPDPSLPKGATVVVQLTSTQVILTGQGFYARCQRCPWVTEEIVHARHQAHDAAKSHEQQACEAGAEGFYVTVKNGSQTGYLLGPYGSKEEAEGNVDRGKRLARQVNDRADFYAYGVTRVVMQPGRELPKGKLNDVELVSP